MQRETDRRRCEAESARQAEAEKAAAEKVAREVARPPGHERALPSKIRLCTDVEDGTWWIVETVLGRLKDRLW